MRIGIDARFLTHPQQGGFKSYTECLLRGLADVDKSFEYILYTDRRIKQLPFDLPDNFRIKRVWGVNAILREQVALPLAMRRDGVDVAHYLCNTGSIFPICPSVLTVHDTMPIDPGWLRNFKGRSKDMLLRCYWRGVIPPAMRRATRVITVSNTSRCEIVNRVGINPNRISVIPNGVHPDFRPIEAQSDIDRLRENYALPDKYVLAFASSDPRKNLEGVLAAWDRARPFTLDHWLVVVCASPSAVKAVRKRSGRSPEAHRILIVSGLPRKDLAVLYGAAELLLFPSFREGFGLPVIEAMACGTPVLTSNISAMPEVAGDAAQLVSPTDIASMSKIIVALLSNEARRRELSAKGLKRAADYTWDRTASATLGVYEKVGRKRKLRRKGAAR